MKPELLALGAIALWSVLAALGVALAHVPPFLLTGIGLLVGSLLALPMARGRWQTLRVPLPTLALGVYGLFGFHLLLFLALRHAPAVQANLINYLWPLGIVVLAPLMLPGLHWRWAHLGAAALGFAGAAVAILGRAPADGAVLSGGWHVGYLFALASALIWATYSLGTRRVPAFPTAAVGSFGAVSGLLSLLCHALLEPPASLSVADWLQLVVLGLGPLGAGFYLWDAALKRGDPRRIGLLAFLTPLLSTLVMVWITGQPFSTSIALAALMIVAAAVWGSRIR